MRRRDPTGEEQRLIVVKFDATEMPPLLSTRDYWDFAGKYGEAVERELVRRAQALPPISKIKRARKSQAWPTPSVEPKPPSPPPPKSISIDVSGAGAKAAGRDFIEKHYHEGARVEHVLEREGDEISNAQARQIQEQIAELATLLLTTKKGRITSEKAFGEIQNRFKRRMQTKRYDALKTHQFDAAMAWFRTEKAKLTPKLRRIDNQSWRNARYGSIKKAMKKLGMANSDFYPSVARRLKLPIFEHLTDLEDSDLERVYKMALNDARSRRV